MTFLTALYNLFIGPLELFFEIIFVIANRLIRNSGLSIIVLSLVMNFLVLPLYRRADAMQEEQRETEKRLKKWVTHIKKNFKGDERFMMLQTYYRQNNYKPTSILRGSVSLLLEIPFFIAAYNFLSHAGIFDGFAFGPFSDLGKPDGLIKIGNIAINFLPILMTGINIISSAIYTKGLPTSSKVQLYGMAGIFLILLYNSPAALVFYWTLNNLFSLVKNLFYKLKNPAFIFGILSSIAGALSLIFVLFIHHFDTAKKNIFVIGFALLLELPLIWYFLKDKIKLNRQLKLTKTDKTIFFLSTCLLAVVIGILIPSAVIKSSPEEFINTVTHSNPSIFVLNSALLAIGTFVIWFSLFYFLSSNKGKKVIGIIVSILAACCLVNYMFFGTDLGILTSNLVFEFGLAFSKKEIVINLLTLLGVTILIYLVSHFKSEIIKFTYAPILLVTIFMSIGNFISIGKVYNNKVVSMKEQNNKFPTIPLSKNGKNVMVFMMDRAINSYLPYIFNEKPEVAKQFDGFTYYPNTVSYGHCTLLGSAALYGGYEYTPSELNKRQDELLSDKQNEALKVMPVIFNNNNYKVTVSDPSLAGYDWIPDLSIYDDYANINAYVTIDNNVLGKSNVEIETKKSKLLNRNFFVYGILKTIPPLFQPTLYNGGQYNCIKQEGQICSSKTHSSGIDETYAESEAIIDKLASWTNISNSSENTFFMMSNNMPHEPCLLQEPDYTISPIVDNTEYDATHKDRFVINNRELKMETLPQVQHYHVNVGAYIHLGNFFDFLRKNGVYDNTRIIIVSDHGNELNQFDDMIYDVGDIKKLDIMSFNPILLVKDFNSKGFNTDTSFMSNADVPTLAFRDLVNNPINPFTNKPITNDAKNNGPQLICKGSQDTNKLKGKNTFQKLNWYSVHDNIFNGENWTKAEGDK